MGVHVEDEETKQQKEDNVIRKSKKEENLKNEKTPDVVETIQEAETKPKVLCPIHDLYQD